MFLASGEVAVNLGVSVVFGLICALVANGRGRSAIGWFFVGLLTSCLGLIILLVIEDLSKSRYEQQKRDNETRRLREQLRAERQVGDQRHEEVSRRLVVHDRALGIDTAPPPPSALGGVPGGSSYAASAWFFDAGNGERRGPMAFSELRDAWREGLVRVETHVWTEGMADWRRVRELPGMAHDLAS